MDLKIMENVFLPPGETTIFGSRERAKKGADLCFETDLADLKF